MKAKKFTVLQIEKAMNRAFAEMSEAMYEKTIKGKGSYTDVTQEDWDACGFTQEDIVKMTINYLTC